MERATQPARGQAGMLEDFQQRLRVDAEEERQQGDGHQHDAAGALAPVERCVVLADAGLDQEQVTMTRR